MTINMAKSSIVKTFIISGVKKVLLFWKALELSYRASKDTKELTQGKIIYLDSHEEIAELMEKRDKGRDK